MRSEGSVAKLLLLLLLLKLLTVTLELRRSAWLSHGWCVNHAVLRWSTAITTSGGTWHGPLLILLSLLTSLHDAILVNGSAGKVIVGQV
jgi:steroid 5-alpha reductase family enzyme